MFERFTEGARRVVVLAQQEARILKHSFIGTEHILLGLLREGEGLLPARVLQSLDITVERVRPEVVRLVARARKSPPARSRSPRLQRRLAERERKVSYERRILHGKIDILRAELANRRGRGEEPASQKPQDPPARSQSLPLSSKRFLPGSTSSCPRLSPPSLEPAIGPSGLPHG